MQQCTFFHHILTSHILPPDFETLVLIVHRLALTFQNKTFDIPHLACTEAVGLVGAFGPKQALPSQPDTILAQTISYVRLSLRSRSRSDVQPQPDSREALTIRRTRQTLTLGVPCSRLTLSGSARVLVSTSACAQPQLASRPSLRPRLQASVSTRDPIGTRQLASASQLASTSQLTSEVHPFILEVRFNPTNKGNSKSENKNRIWLFCKD
ncbi:hypothetical protein F2Q70_00030737 [Brassica cretica]|uniref:Uncharacterized protein n=1 Tax=Brassica cretica TaxID=69181 RepID=A0A8S9FL64_BRACR|nr:hypothetical protein F2Q70_00030737 [Brassica cretica]